MPNKPATPNRAVRIDDETWTALGEATEAAGTDRSAVLRELARWWLRRPGAKLPARPSGMPAETTTQFRSSSAIEWDRGGHDGT